MLHGWRMTHLSRALPAPQEDLELMSRSPRSRIFGLGYVVYPQCRSLVALKEAWLTHETVAQCKCSNYDRLTDIVVQARFGISACGKSCSLPHTIDGYIRVHSHNRWWFIKPIINTNQPCPKFDRCGLHLQTCYYKSLEYMQTSIFEGRFDKKVRPLHTKLRIALKLAWFRKSS